MKRKSVFPTTTKDVSSVDDRSVELDHPGGNRDEPAAAPALLVKSIKFSGVTAGSKIRLTVPVLPDLYLETITLIKGGPADTIEGTVSKGTLKARGSANATISAELYDFVLSQVRASKLLIRLEHSDAQVTNISFEDI